MAQPSRTGHDRPLTDHLIVDRTTAARLLGCSGSTLKRKVTDWLTLHSLEPEPQRMHRAYVRLTPEFVLSATGDEMAWDRIVAERRQPEPIARHQTPPTPGLAGFVTIPATEYRGMCAELAAGRAYRAAMESSDTSDWRQHLTG